VPEALYVRGDRAFGRLIKQLPDDVSDEIRAQLNRPGRCCWPAGQAKAPVYHGKPRKGLTPGALRSGLSYSVPPKRLSLKVGLVGKAINKRLFYGYLVEFGHRIGTRAPAAQGGSKRSPGSIQARLIRARGARATSGSAAFRRTRSSTRCRARRFTRRSGRSGGRALRARSGTSDD
jgi:hypothetical protein